MKQKVGMVIEKDILRLAKLKAEKEGRPLSNLIQDALLRYLRRGAATPKERRLAFQLFCERPMKIARDQLRHILAEDMWNL